MYQTTQRLHVGLFDFLHYLNDVKPGLIRQINLSIAEKLDQKVGTVSWERPFSGRNFVPVTLCLLFYLTSFP